MNGGHGNKPIFQLKQNGVRNKYQEVPSQKTDRY